MLRNGCFAFIMVFVAVCSSHAQATADGDPPSVEQNISAEEESAPRGRSYFWEGLPSEVSPEFKEDRYQLFGRDTRATLDATSRDVAENLDTFVNRIDTFFVDERIDTMYRGNRIRLRFGATLEERGRSKLLSGVRLNLHFPRTEDRLGIFVESYSLSEDAASDDEVVPRRDEDNESFATGFRAYLTESEFVDSKLDVGVKWDPSPDPFTRLRVSKDLSIAEQTIFRPTQYVSYKLEEGAGERTRFDLERRLTAVTLIRSRTNFTWSEETVRNEHGVEWDSAISLYHTFSNLRGIRAEARIEGYTRPTCLAEKYITAIGWRESLYSDWLFYEVSPFLEWIKKEGFDTMPGVTFFLEVNFRAERLQS